MYLTIKERNNPLFCMYNVNVTENFFYKLAYFTCQLGPLLFQNGDILMGKN